jgi:electron transfer flavoprotein beta subunit
MKVLVCVKRVPDTGGGFKLTPDSMRLDTTNLGFTVSPHEECAIEEAIRIVEKHGGSSTVLTLGPQAAAEQLREAIAKGITSAILLEAEDYEFWDPAATAQAIAEAVKPLGV